MDVPAGVEFTPGEIVVGHIRVVHDLPQVYILEIDCVSKYARIAALLGGEGIGTEVMLYAGEDTLRKDETTSARTRIVLPGRTADWQLMLDGSKYLYHVIAWTEE